MFLIIDTYGGLCNQFYDINASINFCLQNSISFTFRYASFRNSDLTSWTNVPFNQLFETSVFKQFQLYVDFNEIQSLLTEENTFNLNENKTCVQFLNSIQLLQQLNEINKPYIVLKQFWAVSNGTEPPIVIIYNQLKPCRKLMDEYEKIKETILDKDPNEPYNFLHYRYESDFVNHFKLTNVIGLSDIIQKNTFKNKNLKTYIACTNPNNLIENPSIHNVIFKDDNLLNHYNFEEKAFIDYMFGRNSVEVCGHEKSAFSSMLNFLKGTSNYY